MRIDPSYDEILKTTLLKLLDGVQRTGEWVAGQIPDVLHQLIVWTMVKGVVAFLLVLGFIIGWPWLMRHNKRMNDDARKAWDDTPRQPAAFVIGIIISVILLLAAFPAMADALKAIFAPKLFLLEYAADLVRSTKQG